MTSYDKAKLLLEKYSSGSLSEEEKALVEKWLFDHLDDGAELPEEVIEAMSERVWKELPINRVKRRLLWPKLTAAICLALVLGAGAFYYYKSGNRPEHEIAKTVEGEVLPGGNKAILTLANGKKINLTDADNGELTKQSGIQISKTSDGQLVYQVIGSATSLPEEMKYNKVETPRGGQYQINLPDGTRVWLNAASSLKFPLSFSDLKERKVELHGEGYFEVVKDQHKPFIVQSEKQSVTVLGTHFNVSSYPDEPVVKTTLLEGSVKVRNELGQDGRFSVLVPGQQSQISSSADIAVVKVDPQTEVAWKNGFFSFENEPIERIMRQISRWYDVDIVYNDNVSGKTVWGSITRYSDVSKVLSIVERTGKVHFKVAGRRVIVSK